MNAKKIVASYLILQAAGVAAWWGLLLLVPPTVSWFQPESWPRESLYGFWLADSVLLVAGSLVVAVGVLRRSSWATIAVWSIAAVVWYPTLFCVGVSIMTNEAWIASSMMISMAGLTLAMATIHGHADQEAATIRVTAMSKKTAISWTIIQTFIFWSVFLWILPNGIVELEQRIAWASFEHTFQVGGSIGLFLVASALGLYGGLTMAIQGDGTPLPTATAPKLVMAGPYRFVRNPMAVAGVVQGIAVGWYLGSYGVIAYSIAGAFLWHWFVRPVEEADLQDRFGESYSDYRQTVGLWIPRRGWRKSSK